MCMQLSVFGGSKGLGLEVLGLNFGLAYACQCRGIALRNHCVVLQMLAAGSTV